MFKTQYLLPIAVLAAFAGNSAPWELTIPEEQVGLNNAQADLPPPVVYQGLSQAEQALVNNAANRAEAAIANADYPAAVSVLTGAAEILLKDSDIGHRAVRHMAIRLIQRAASIASIERLSDLRRIAFETYVRLIPPRTSEMISSYNADGMTLLSFNMHIATRSEEGPEGRAYPEMLSHSRALHMMEELYFRILTENPDVIQLQEVRNFVSDVTGQQIDNLTYTVKFLEHLGYKVIVKLCNPESLNKPPFYYITAFNPARFEVDRVQSLWFTESETVTDRKNLSAEEVKRNNFGADRERSTLVLSLRDRQGRRFHVFNVYLDMAKEARIGSSGLLVKWAKQLIAEDPDTKIVMAGDFNTIPGFGDDEQLQIMRDPEAFNHVSGVGNRLRLPSGEPIDWSFIPYPHDLYGPGAPSDEENKAVNRLSPEAQRQQVAEYYVRCFGSGFNGILDNALTQGFREAAFILSPTPLFGDLPDYQTTSIVSYVAGHIGQLNESREALRLNNGAAFASDHQMLVVKLKL